MAIPSGYTRVEYIQSSGTQYINTGIAPSDYLLSLRVVAEMSYVTRPSGSSTQSYLFGTGHYTSTAGNRRNVLVGYRGATSTSLFAYLNDGQLSNAVAFTGATLDTNRHIFTIDQPNSQYGFDGSTQSFGSTDQSTNTNPLLIFCARQSGSSGAPIGYYSSARLYSFKIYNGDTLIRDFVPVQRDNDSVYGLYDEANDVFYTNAGSGSFTGGSPVYEIIANASPSDGGTVTGSGYYPSGTTVTLTATASGRYTFQSWSDGVTDNPRVITVSGDGTYTANFSRSKIIIGEEYRLYGTKRNNAVLIPSIFTNVMSADISEDLLQKASSTIVCAEETGLEESDLVVIRDGKGNIIFQGVVQTVNGKTITANQIQSLFDFSLYAMADTSTDKAEYSTYTPLVMTRRYLKDIAGGRYSTRDTTSGGEYVAVDGLDRTQARMNGFNVMWYGSLDALPYRTESEVINGEELLYQMYSQYEIIPFGWFELVAQSGGYLERPVFYVFTAESVPNGYQHIPAYKKINLGNNSEFISNIQVISEIEDTNVLVIYDSAGTTYRGAYDVLTDGTYGDNTGIVNRYIPPKRKYINSDEALTTVRNNELKLIQYNHKVNFTLDLDNNFYDFGDIHLGQSINFYVGDRLYNSVLTGWSFHIEQGQTLKQINMVCGKVRNNLTSKLNLGKVK